MRLYPAVLFLVRGAGQVTGEEFVISGAKAGAGSGAEAGAGAGAEAGAAAGGVTPRQSFRVPGARSGEGKRATIWVSPYVMGRLPQYWGQGRTLHFSARAEPFCG